MAIKLIINSQSDLAGTKSWERCFDQHVIRIGRTASNDLSLQDPQRIISSRHAEIRRKPDHYVLLDIGSTNGTRINDQRAITGKEYPLHDGDRIRIGEFIISFRLSTPSDNETLPASAPHARAVSSVEHFHGKEALAYRMRRLYANLSQRDTEER